ncbi:MAG: AraC family transcriptional regulator [Bdellovibrionia bacterium]
MKRGQDLFLNLPGIYVIHQNLPGKEVELHEHEEHVLFLPLHGEIQIELETRTLACGPGRLIYLPPKTPHAFESSDKEGERLIALISAKRWKNARLPKLDSTVGAANGLVKELLFQLILKPESKNTEAAIDLFVRTLAENLENSEAVSIDHLEGKAKDLRLIKALELLRTRIDSPPSVTELTKYSGLSTRTLNRLFILELGVSPKQASTAYRVEHAKHLLLTGRASVTDAAYAAGYQSLSQFITVFRQVTGRLPSEIRRGG